MTNNTQQPEDDELEQVFYDFAHIVRQANFSTDLLSEFQEALSQAKKAIRTKYISREEIKVERLEAVRDWLRWASLGQEPMDSNSINGYINGLTENIDIMRRELGLGGEDNGKA
jgi:hypothetical protein